MMCPQTQKDLPVQFLSTSEPLGARFLIGSFGDADAYNGAAFQLAVARNPDEPVPTVEVSRYGKLPEIHHIFKADAQSPPVVISLAFVAMVLATLPVLGGVVGSSPILVHYLSNCSSGFSSAPTSTTCLRH